MSKKDQFLIKLDEELEDFLGNINIPINKKPNSDLNVKSLISEFYWIEEQSENLSFQSGKSLLSQIKEYRKSVEPEISSGTISWELIPLYFKRGEIYLFTTELGLVAGKISSVSKENSFFGGQYYEVTYDNISQAEGDNKFWTVQNHLNIYEYKGVLDIKDKFKTFLLEKDSEEYKYLLNRGRKYKELVSTPSYVFYKGDQINRGWMGSILKSRVDNRILIDKSAMKLVARIDSDYGGDEVDLINEDNYILFPPNVYGFSFSTKSWGEFLIDSISDISFRDESFNHNLVLDKEIKDTILALVSSVKSKKDFIDNKGGGLIFLCHGNPGTGKTSSAELVAEKLHRPLYSISVGELGTTPDKLETVLKNALKIASRWNAIILLDEADIFLEQRDSSNINRNAMVGIFLRTLEYYDGIMFLTTNRVSNLDSAFFSRISMPIRYKDLTKDSRKLIWENHLKLNELHLSDSEIDSLSDYDLNGRQIKNAVAVAIAKAEFYKTNISLDILKSVINNTINFIEDIKP